MISLLSARFLDALAQALDIYDVFGALHKSIDDIDSFRYWLKVQHADHDIYNPLSVSQNYPISMSNNQP